jgi:hypothetical protein
MDAHDSRAPLQTRPPLTARPVVRTIRIVMPPTQALHTTSPSPWRGNLINQQTAVYLAGSGRFCCLRILACTDRILKSRRPLVRTGAITNMASADKLSALAFSLCSDSLGLPERCLRESLMADVLLTLCAQWPPT